MNTEEMFPTILNRMDSIEAGLTGLNAKLDKLDGRIDKLQLDVILELYLVRREIFGRNKLLEKEIDAHSNIADKLVRDIEKYDKKNDKINDRKYDKIGDKINTRFEALEKTYQELKENICQ